MLDRSHHGTCMFSFFSNFFSLYESENHWSFISDLSVRVFGTSLHRRTVPPIGMYQLFSVRYSSISPVLVKFRFANTSDVPENDNLDRF